ncbi:MAG: DUF1801 domain-containing protein [Bacteroidota bacterium]
MEAVLDFIYSLEEPQQGTMLRMHELLTAFPNITCKIRYRVPFYYQKSWLCYLNPVKNEQIEWVLLRGNELSNVQGALETRGRKQVAGILFGSPADINPRLIEEIFSEALLLDENIPYASKRKKK